MRFPGILKIIDALPAVTDMQEMMNTAGCVSRVRDIGLPGEVIEESLLPCTVYKKKAESFKTSKDAHILIRKRSQ